jgi:hypothetical protein
MGANVFSRPQTLHDPIRFFSQVTESQFDSSDGDTPRNRPGIP